MATLRKVRDDNNSSSASTEKVVEAAMNEVKQEYESVKVGFNAKLVQDRGQ